MRKLLTVIVAVMSLEASYAFGEAGFQGLGANRCGANSISDDGTVLVGSQYVGSWSCDYAAVRWSEATGWVGLKDLPPSGYVSGNNCYASGVSADGTVIVGAGSSAYVMHPNEACRWISPTYSPQGLGSSTSRASAVSADGSVIVGTNSSDEAFRWTEATGMVGLGGGPSSSASDISADGSVVVGTWNDEAFRWTATTGMVGLGYLPGASWSQASRVSADGLVIVGTCGYSWSSYQEAFRWTAATGMVGLGYLPGTSKSQATGVSGDGSVIVGQCDGQVFVWDAINGMRNLQDVLINDFGLDLTGWSLYYASDVSADGQRIVGAGINPAGSSETWLATIPAPIMFVLSLDIKPGACPNPLNIRPGPKDMWMPGEETPTAAKVAPNGPKRPIIRLPAAILGTVEFEVADIDPASITLEGVAVLHWNIEDVSTPVSEGAEECDCTDEGADGYQDLTLKFDKSLVIEALGEICVGDTIPLMITGELTDGTPFEGTDCVVIVGGPPPSEGTANSDESKEVILIGNFPNPFNPATEISFSLASATKVKLEVFNVMGQKVATLVDGTLESGEHIVQWDGSEAASGVYLYRLQADGFVDTKKMMLLK
jgi:probable HAF family extracellular repeat protein